jgi:hypothetical protein
MKQHGVLPRKGGLLDQDPRFVEAADLIAEEAHAIRKRMEPGPPGTKKL